MHRLSLRETLPVVRSRRRRECELRGFGPATTLEREPCLECREPVYASRIRIVQRAEGMRFGGYLLGVGVIGQLQVGIDHVIPGVGYITMVALGYLDALLVRGDRLTPVTHTRKDMRRHVLCMPGVGSSLRVAFRGFEPLMRDRRIVIAVDQVVRHPWVMGMGGEERLEQTRRPERSSVGLVIEIVVATHNERV